MFNNQVNCLSTQLQAGQKFTRSSTSVSKRILAQMYMYRCQQIYSSAETNQWNED